MNGNSCVQKPHTSTYTYFIDNTRISHHQWTVIGIREIKECNHDNLDDNNNWQSDGLKLMAIPLSDNNRHDKYLYQLVVFTRMRANAGTKSKIDGTINAANKLEKIELKHVLSKNAYRSMADNHLWFSIFAYHLPSANRFTRIQRCTCCFVLLFYEFYYNIQYDDSKIHRWLGLILASFYAAVLLTQPFKVLALALLFICFCRKKSPVEAFIKQEDSVEEFTVSIEDSDRKFLSKSLLAKTHRDLHRAKRERAALKKLRKFV
ncbi:unnamed protein product [Rotaria sp. Silwood2]|nr:unnamed protein product [Rotaria sp. Silwood2]CAF4118622.1 unnamed protein product [Rotaria sp. Silwood2]